MMAGSNTRNYYQNDLEVIRCALQPYGEELQGLVVESTYNWYWLVDGSMALGFDVRLANTVALKQYNGIKYTDDKTGAHDLMSAVFTLSASKVVLGRCANRLEPMSW